MSFFTSPHRCKDPTDDDVVCLDDDSDVEEVVPAPVKSESSAAAAASSATTNAVGGRSSKRPSISGRSDDEDPSMGDSTPKRIKREDSNVSALSGFDAAFGNVLAGLAEEDEQQQQQQQQLDGVGDIGNGDTAQGGAEGGNDKKVAPETIDLLDSSDEEEETEEKPAAESVTNQTQSTATAMASQGWRCPQVSTRYPLVLICNITLSLLNRLYNLQILSYKILSVLLPNCHSVHF